MTVHLPTIKQLQYLVALRQHGHFGKAAEACFVTQSTLSAGLRELETLLNVTLVERTRRVVRFTALGEKIADKVDWVTKQASAALPKWPWRRSATRYCSCLMVGRWTIINR